MSIALVSVQTFEITSFQAGLDRDKQTPIIVWQFSGNERDTVREYRIKRDYRVVHREFPMNGGSTESGGYLFRDRKLGARALIKGVEYSLTVVYKNGKTRLTRREWIRKR